MNPTCIHCQEAIGETDAHTCISVGQVVGNTMVFEPGFAHIECAYRATVGGIGHHLNHGYWCDQVHDPDGGRTYRQSALEVVAGHRGHN